MSPDRTEALVQTDEPDDTPRTLPDTPRTLPDDTPRTLPVPLPDDTWDSAPTRTSRHVRRHRMPPRYLFVGLILAASIVLVILVPLLLSFGPDSDQPSDDAGGPTIPGSTTTVAATTTATATPTPSADATTVDVPAGGEPPFTPLTYEAEAGVLRQAQTVPIDGGSGAQFTDRSGLIMLSVDVPTRDRYRITIVYVADGDWSLELRGFGNPERADLPWASGCCATATVDVRLAPGGTLTIGLSRGDGSLPTIDRIVIDRA
jgi:hypothetical protein